MIEFEKAYLKCNYKEGMFSDEYFVNFEGSLERGTGLGEDYIVMKDKVMVRNSVSGLLKVIVVSREKKTSNILIDGAKDVGASTFFTVSNRNLLY